MWSLGSYAKNVATDTASNVQNSAQDGTLGTKTAENTVYAATEASKMISGIGFSLFNKVKEYSGNNVPGEEVKENDHQIDSKQEN